MNRKFTILTALKKYAKTICLLLALGGVSVVGMAQTYKPLQAATYAQTHYAICEQLCSGFVTHCLQNGELFAEMFTTCHALHKHITNTGKFPNLEWGPLNTTNGTYSIPNDLQPGDIIIWWDRGIGLPSSQNLGQAGGSNHAAILTQIPLKLTATNNRNLNLSFSSFGKSWAKGASYYRLSKLSNFSIYPITEPILQSAGGKPATNYYSPTMHSGEVVNISVNERDIPTSNIRVTMMYLSGEPNRQPNDGEACSGYRAYALKNAQGAYYWQAPSLADSWVKIIAHNTMGTDCGDDRNNAGCSQCSSEIDDSWSNAMYLYVLPNDVDHQDTKPSITNLGSSVNDFVNRNSTNSISIAINGNGWVNRKGGGQSMATNSIWEDYIQIRAILLSGLPNTLDPFSDESGKEIDVFKEITPNAWGLRPQSSWAGKYVKVIAQNRAFNTWSEPRYIYITYSPPLVPNDEPDGAIPTPDHIAPSIKTEYNNCYRAGNTVKVYVSNIDANDYIQLQYCLLEYETRPPQCPCQTVDNVCRFETPLQQAYSIAIPTNPNTSLISFDIQNWNGKTIKINAYNKTKGKWSNPIYIDVRKKDENGVSYLTQCDYTEAFNNTNNYNWRFAYWCGKVAKDSYGTNNATMGALGFNVIHSSEFNNVKFDVGKKTINQQTYVMISIRGTNKDDLVSNWCSNLAAAPKKWNDGKLCFLAVCGTNPAAHGGFYDVYKGIWTQLNNVLYDNSLTYNNCKFIVTGHSLGGAIAELITLRLSEKVSDPQKIVCYGFASPPVGNSSLVNHAGETHIRNRIHKLMNTDDIVPIAGWYAYTLAETIESFFTLGLPSNQYGHSMPDVYLVKLKNNALTWE